MISLLVLVLVVLLIAAVVVATLRTALRDDTGPRPADPTYDTRRPAP
ncbi:hypothetical protein AB2L57_08085 [Microbacterium sp. HA-8]|nr:hypothetical protein [Microbacterium sp.]